MLAAGLGNLHTCAVGSIKMPGPAELALALV